MTLSNGWANGDDQEDDHPDEHNELTDRVVNLEQLVLESPNTGTPLAGGGTAPILQTVYDHGTGPAASVITIDATRETVAIEDASTPTGLALFRVGPSGGPLLEVEAAAVAIGSDAADALTLQGVVACAREPSTGTVELGATTGSTSATNGVDLGTAAGSDGNSSVAIGHDANNADGSAVAIGHGADTQGSNSVAVGKDAYTDGGSALALGSGAGAEATAAVAVGSTASATAANTTAIGTGAGATASGAQAFGTSAAAGSANSLAVGNTAVVAASCAGSLAIGNTAVVSAAANAMALGTGAQALGDDGAALGNGAQAGTSGLAVGPSANAGNYTGGATGGNIAMGHSAQATDTGGEAIAIGAGATASASAAVALGAGASATVADTVVLGTGTHTVTVPGALSVVGATNLAGAVTADTSLVVAGPIGVLAGGGLAVTLMENTDTTDSDGGRVTSFAALGYTAAATRHALGGITFEHDGSSSDQRGRIRMQVNGGADGLAPSTGATLDYQGNLDVAGELGASGELEWNNGDQAVRTDSSEVTAPRTITVPDDDVDLGEYMLVEGFEVANLAASATTAGTHRIRGEGFRVPWDYTLVMVTAMARGTPTSGHTATAQMKVNGTPVGTAVTVSNGSPTAQQAETITGSAGDFIECEFVGGGTWTNRNVVANVFLLCKVK